MRAKDIHDIGIILKNYFNLETETIYANHADLFDAESSLELVAARALGREMQKVLNQNPLLKERALRILDENIRSLETSVIGRMITNASNFGSIEEAVKILEEMVRGIKDSI